MLKIELVLESGGGLEAWFRFAQWGNLKNLSFHLTTGWEILAVSHVVHGHFCIPGVGVVIYIALVVVCVVAIF
eukprot:3241720-Ditylum_brightwellii.AAC.1